MGNQARHRSKDCKDFMATNAVAKWLIWQRSMLFIRLFITVAVICSLACSSTVVFAAGPFDVTDPDYTARGARFVAQGKISKQCLPSAAGAVDPSYITIDAPSPGLVDAAFKEGTLTLNSGISDLPSVDSYTSAFSMRYPQIKLNVIAGGGAAAEERFLADHAAGNNKIDGAISVMPTWIAKALKEKAVVPLDQTIPGFFDHWPGGHWKWESEAGATATAFYRSIGIGFNSDLVKGDLIPKSYQDLARPEFRDQLLGLNPEAAGVYGGVWKHILDTVGEDKMRDIGRNLIKVPLYADIQPASQALGAGAGMVIMQLGGNVAQTMRQSGAPVETIMPENAVATQYAYVVASKSQHPNAAKLFAHWLYSAEGQWVMSCGALAGTLAYPAFGAKQVTPVAPVSKDQVAKIKELLGL